MSVFVILTVVAVVGVIGYAVYKTWKAHKAVTVGNVVTQFKSDKPVSGAGNTNSKPL